MNGHCGVSLSDDQIAEIAGRYQTGRAQGDYDFARAIERAVLDAAPPPLHARHLAVVKAAQAWGQADVDIPAELLVTALRLREAVERIGNDAD